MGSTKSSTLERELLGAGFNVLKNRRTFFKGAILEWYREFGREFPWRTAGDPFKVLVAEVMLQQTFAAKVVPVYIEFFNFYPSPERVSRARVNNIEKIIRPLGLLYRAQLLKDISRTLVREFDGHVPKEEGALMSLPGVGRYMASAVRSFGFDEWAPVLDANVIRILWRVFAVQQVEQPKSANKMLWSVAEFIAPEGSTRDYNFGLLDFGSVVCTFYNPRCDSCVLNKICNSYNMYS